MLVYCRQSNKCDWRKNEKPIANPLKLNRRQNHLTIFFSLKLLNIHTKIGESNRGNAIGYECD